MVVAAYADLNFVVYFVGIVVPVNLDEIGNYSANLNFAARFAGIADLENSNDLYFVSLIANSACRRIDRDNVDWEFG